MGAPLLLTGLTGPFKRGPGPYHSCHSLTCSLRACRNCQNRKKIRNDARCAPGLLALVLGCRPDRAPPLRARPLLALLACHPQAASSQQRASSHFISAGCALRQRACLDDSPYGPLCRDGQGQAPRIPGSGGGEVRRRNGARAHQHCMLHAAQRSGPRALGPRPPGPAAQGRTATQPSVGHAANKLALRHAARCSLLTSVRQGQGPRSSSSPERTSCLSLWAGRRKLAPGFRLQHACSLFVCTAPAHRRPRRRLVSTSLRRA